MRQLLARWCPATLLVAVAVSQIYLAKTGTLASSKGGGFGMFSVTDIRSNRSWSADCLTPDRRPCRIYLPIGEGPILRRHSRYRVKPDAGISNEVADSLAKARFVSIDPDDLAREAGLPVGTVLSREIRDAIYYRLAEDGEQGVELPAIRLRAWRIRYVGEIDGYRVEPLGEPVERGRW